RSSDLKINRLEKVFLLGINRNTFLLFVLCYFENSGGKLVRSMPHTIGNKTATAIVTRTIPIILSTNPAFAISVMRKYPDPNTTAFGGVATGSINAQEAATPAAIMTE